MLRHCVARRPLDDAPPGIESWTGDVAPLAAGLAAPRSLRLERTRAFASGVVELVYARR